MNDIVALDILLHDRRIGRIARLEGDRSIFTFDDNYLADHERPTLSLTYRDEYGGIINEPRAYQTKLEPFFSNLLPEGVLRDYLSKRAGVCQRRSKNRPLWRSKSRPLTFRRVQSKGPRSGPFAFGHFYGSVFVDGGLVLLRPAGSGATATG